jgi:hypothetical protein
VAGSNPEKTTRVDNAHQSMDCRAVYDGSQ